MEVIMFQSDTVLPQALDHASKPGGQKEANCPK